MTTIRPDFGTPYAGAVDADPSPWLEERAWAVEDFTAAVYDLARSIPPGRVMTYGSLAAALGLGAPRAAGPIMAHSDGLPRWRLAYPDGHILPHYWDEAIAQYRAEGTPLLETRDGVRIDIRQARWGP